MHSRKTNSKKHSEKKAAKKTDPEDCNASSEAADILRSLLSDCFSKRSAGDIFSLAVDPGAGFRLKSEHRSWYDAEIGDAQTFGAWEFMGDSFAQRPGDAASVAGRALALVAMAALFARAAYGDAIRRRAEGDTVTPKGQCTGSNRANDMRAFLELSGSDPADVLLSSWKERTFEPAFVILRVPALRWIVVAIRGSQNTNALLTDLAAATCEVAGGKAHAGMLRSAWWLLEHAHPTLSAALAQHPNYIVVCTGHSMGGGVAGLLALLLRDISAPACFENAVAYSFGGAPLLTPELAAKCESFILSVGRNLDLVTRLSAFSVDCLLFEMTERSAPRVARRWLKKGKSKSKEAIDTPTSSCQTAALPLPSWLKSKKTSDTSPSSNPSHHHRIFGTDASLVEALVPPGKLLHMDSCSCRGKTSPRTKGVATRSRLPELYWPSAKFYQRILIGSSMLRDHYQLNYLEDLLRILYQRAPPHIAHELYIVDRASDDQRAEWYVRAALEALVANDNSEELATPNILNAEVGQQNGNCENADLQVCPANACRETGPGLARENDRPSSDEAGDLCEAPPHAQERPHFFNGGAGESASGREISLSVLGLSDSSDGDSNQRSSGTVQSPNAVGVLAGWEQSFLEGLSDSNDSDERNDVCCQDLVTEPHAQMAQTSMTVEGLSDVSDNDDSQG